MTKTKCLTCVPLRLSTLNLCKMANITVCFSSDSCEWTTPDELFRQLDDEFHFNLDPCSTDANAKCERHFTIADDGLSQNWGGVSGILQPAVWTRNRRVGRKMFHGIPQGGHRRRSPDTGANRHEIFSQIHLSQRRRNSIHRGTVAVRRFQTRRAVSVNDCCFSA